MLLSRQRRLVTAMSDSEAIRSGAAEKPRFISKPRITLALLALVFATLVCVAMLLARTWFAGEVKFSFLPGNLLLAWIPAIFAIAVYSLHVRRSRRWPVMIACAAVWFFFYPNAPYLITDLVHLKTRPPIPRWYDLIVFMSFAWTGLFLGYLSLYLMQEIVRDWLGRRTAWSFAVLMLGLGSLGVFVGRFWRWNSWEVITRPLGLASDVLRRIRSMEPGEVAAFSLTFFFFSLFIYCTLYAVTHLHSGEDAVSGAEDARL